MYDYSALRVEVLFEDERTSAVLGTCRCGRVLLGTSQRGRDVAETNLRIKYRNHIERGSDRLCPHGLGRSK